MTMDKFLWRVHSAMRTDLHAQRLMTVETYLSMLASYMESCPTLYVVLLLLLSTVRRLTLVCRVMASQVIEVCMPTLMEVKVPSHVESYM